MPSKPALLKAIENEVLALKQSPLYSYRVKNGYFPVIGEGSLDAPLIFIGEAPGKKEAETGRPFIGASGKVLDGLLASIKLKREEAYVTSVVKDRPPENRDPSPTEIALYAPFLIRQIELIKPRVIATLGRHAMACVLRHFDLEDSLAPISELHGRPLAVKAPWGELTILPLYHPAAALYNGSLRATLLSDFERIRKFI